MAPTSSSAPTTPWPRSIEDYREDKKFVEAMGGEEAMAKFDKLFGEAVDSSRSELFSINPKQSYVTDDWIKADPEFWKPKPRRSMAATAKPTAKVDEAYVTRRRTTATIRPISCMKRFRHCRSRFFLCAQCSDDSRLRVKYRRETIDESADIPSQGSSRHWSRHAAFLHPIGRVCHLKRVQARNPIA